MNSDIKFQINITGLLDQIFKIYQEIIQLPEIKNFFSTKPFQLTSFPVSIVRVNKSLKDNLYKYIIQFEGLTWIECKTEKYHPHITSLKSMAMTQTDSRNIGFSYIVAVTVKGVGRSFFLLTNQLQIMYLILKQLYLAMPEKNLKFTAPKSIRQSQMSLPKEFWGQQGNWITMPEHKEFYKKNIYPLNIDLIKNYILPKIHDPFYIMDIGGGLGENGIALLNLAQSQHLPLHYIFLEPDDFQCDLAVKNFKNLEQIYEGSYIHNVQVFNMTLEGFIHSEKSIPYINKINNIICSGGPLNISVASWEVAQKCLTAVKALLAPAGILINTGKTPSRFNKKDFIRYGFIDIATIKKYPESIMPCGVYQKSSFYLGLPTNEEQKWMNGFKKQSYIFLRELATSLSLNLLIYIIDSEDYFKVSSLNSKHKYTQQEAKNLYRNILLDFFVSPTHPQFLERIINVFKNGIIILNANKSVNYCYTSVAGIDFNQLTAAEILYKIYSEKNLILTTLFQEIDQSINQEKIRCDKLDEDGCASLLYLKRSLSFEIKQSAQLINSLVTSFSLDLFTPWMNAFKFLTIRELFTTIVNKSMYTKINQLIVKPLFAILHPDTDKDQKPRAPSLPNQFSFSFITRSKSAPQLSAYNKEKTMSII